LNGRSVSGNRQQFLSFKNEMLGDTMHSQSSRVGNTHLTVKSSVQDSRNVADSLNGKKVKKNIFWDDIVIRERNRNLSSFLNLCWIGNQDEELTCINNSHGMPLVCSNPMRCGTRVLGWFTHFFHSRVKTNDDEHLLG